MHRNADRSAGPERERRNAKPDLEAPADPSGDDRLRARSRQETARLLRLVATFLERQGRVPARLLEPLRLNGQSQPLVRTTDGTESVAGEPGEGGSTVQGDSAVLPHLPEPVVEATQTGSPRRAKGSAASDKAPPGAERAQLFQEIDS